MIDVIMEEKTISINKSEYDDLKTKAIDWENMYIIMEKCDKDSAYDAIKAILGVWDDVPKELKVVEL